MTGSPQRDDGSLRVLRVITTLEPEVGGPSTSAVNGAVAEQGANIATTIVSTTSSGRPCETPPSLVRAGIAHRCFQRPRILGDLGKRWGLSARFGLWILRHTRRFDVVHVHYVWALGTVVAILAAALWRRPVVMTPHESLTSFGIGHSRSNQRRREKLLARRLLLAGVDRVITASALEQRDSGLSSELGRVIQHPVPHAATTTSEVREGARGRRIGFLGRLHPKKRLGDLLDAFSALDGDATLVIGGNQPAAAFAKLRDRVAADIRARDVELLGFVTDSGRDAFLASIDVLVMPSTYECFGMVAAEALSAGVPVIVTEPTGIAEVVRKHAAGLVIPVGDPSAIRVAIERILANPAQLTVMRGNARRAARTQLSFAAYADAIRAVYDEVTS